MHLSTVEPNAALFKRRQPPLPRSHVMTLGSPSSIMSRPRGLRELWRLRSLTSGTSCFFPLFWYFSFTPPGAPDAIVSPGKASGTEAGPSTQIHGGEPEASGSRPLPMLRCRLATAGTAVQGDEEESQLWGAASLLFYVRTGEG